MEEKATVQRSGRKTVRLFIYLILLAGLLLAIYLQIKKIERHTGRQIASIYSEWTQNGKPVNVLRANKKTFRIYEKTTVKLSKEGTLEGFITRDLFQKIRIGQNFYLEQNSDNPIGSVAEISDATDINNGLYGITLKTTKKVSFANPGIIPVRINTRNIENIIYVPVRSVLKEGGSSYVWVADKGIAKKIQVVTADSDDLNVVLKSGIKQGDFIIVDGLSVINVGDVVFVHKCDGCSEKNSFPPLRLRGIGPPQGGAGS